MIPGRMKQTILNSIAHDKERINNRNAKGNSLHNRSIIWYNIFYCFSRMKLRSLKITNNLYIVNGVVVASSWNGFMEFCNQHNLFIC